MKKLMRIVMRTLDSAYVIKGFLELLVLLYSYPQFTFTFTITLPITKLKV